MDLLTKRPQRAAPSHIEPLVDSGTEVIGTKSLRATRESGMADSGAGQRRSNVAPRGFEPPTQGLGNLCSIP